MGIYQFSLCCPDCGGEQWHDMPNLKSNEFCCCNCGTVCTIDEMETALEILNRGDL